MCLQQIVNRHPYHIDSLLQLSEICKMQEDSQMAAELIGKNNTSYSIFF